MQDRVDQLLRPCSPTPRKRQDEQVARFVSVVEVVVQLLEFVSGRDVEETCVQEQGLLVSSLAHGVAHFSPRDCGDASDKASR